MLRVWPRLLTLPLLLLVVTSAFAQRDRDTYNPGNQSFEVSGQVNVADTNEPARDVPVRLERFSGGLVDQMSTDSRGRFRFSNLQRGYYKVVINAPGFGPAQQEADLTLLFKAYLLFALVTNKPTSLATATGAGEVIDARLPAGAREEFAQGRTALVKKSYPDAIAHLQKAIVLYSDFFDAQLLLATALIDTREWIGAEGSLQRALELKPDSAAATISLGEVYWRQKRFPEAEAALLAGLKLDDKSWHGYFTLGRLYWEMGDVAKAGPPLGKTLQLKPDFAEAHLLAGNILLKVNQQQRALVEYQEYLKLAPKGEFAPQAKELVQKLQKAVAEKQLK
jgi:tetratricopeptide (TPR) repeat protein